VTPRRRPLRLASPCLVTLWFRLHPAELRRLCLAHTGVKLWTDGHPIIDVRRFETLLAPRGGAHR
jgi:hypothetical protein